MELSISSPLSEECPETFTDRDVWFNIASFCTPRRARCTFKALTPIYDTDTDRMYTRPNVTVTPRDWSGVDGIKGTSKILGLDIPPYFNKFVSRLQSNGYKLGENIFGAPYDWRFGVDQPPEFWAKLMELCERAVNSTGKKAKILTHSMGGPVIHSFLTKHSTKEWRDKYLSRVIFSAPSWSGSGSAHISLWRKQILFLPAKNPDLEEFLHMNGGLYVHFPNSKIYANSTMYTCAGRNITGAELLDFFVESGKLTEKQIKPAKRNLAYASEFPSIPDLPIRVLYNSGVKTSVGLDLRSKEDKGKARYGPGDGVVSSEGVDWVCREWENQGADIKCIDLKSRTFMHWNFLLRKNTQNILLEWLEEGEDAMIGEETAEL